MKLDPALKRVGEFEISFELIQRAPDEVLKILEGCIPLHADPRLDRQTIVYAAIHPGFDEVPDGEVAPRYIFELDFRTGLRTWRRRNSPIQVR